MSLFMVLAFVVVIIGFVLLLRPELLWRLLHKDKKAVLPGGLAALLRLGGIGCMFLSVCFAQLV